MSHSTTSTWDPGTVWDPTTSRKSTMPTTAAPRAKRGTLILASDVVLAACKRLKGVASTRSPIAAYRGVMITSGPRLTTMDATDGQLACRVPVSTKGTALEVLVSLVELETAVRQIKADHVEIRMDGDRLQVAGGRRTVRLSQLRKADFIHPAFVTSGKKIVHLPVAEAARALKPALAFASKDETRPILTGVCLDVGQRMVVATDSYRIGMFPIKMTARSKDRLNVPAAAIAQAIKHPADQFKLTVQDGKGPRQTCSIEVGNGVVYKAVLIDGKYPDYTQLIPDRFEHEASVLRDDLAAAVAFVKTAVGYRDAVKIVPSKGTLHLYGSTPDGPHADEPVPANWKGKPMADAVGLAPDFLAQTIAALEPLRGERLTVQMISPLRPVMFTGRDGKAMVMTIRLNH